MNYKLSGIAAFAGSILCVFAGYFILAMLGFVAGVVLCFVYTKKYGVDKKAPKRSRHDDSNYTATTWWYMENN
jgi:hypothetical protein